MKELDMHGEEHTIWKRILYNDSDAQKSRLQQYGMEYTFHCYLKLEWFNGHWRVIANTIEWAIAYFTKRRSWLQDNCLYFDEETQAISTIS
jgi:hypothetical protein